VAVAHSLMAYHLLKRHCTYEELGADYFDRLDAGAIKQPLLKKLTSLGYQVTLTPICPETQPKSVEDG
jgi:hypothetical protein